MKKIQYTAILLLICSAAWSQGLTDALRLSDYRLNGTARATAMGNAFGSLGGDFTSASINPAGIGLYRSGEFILTTRMGENNVDGIYLGRTTNESNFHLSVPNIGYVATFNSMQNNGSPLISVNLGIGYNRMSDFNMKKLVYGDNATSSMLDLFIVNSDDLAPEDLDEYYEQLAVTELGTNLIYDDNNDGLYEHDMLATANPSNFQNYEHSQRKSLSQKGSVDEYVFSVAANFNHRVYLGATLGIQNVYFKERTSLFEYDADNSIQHFNDYTFDTYLKTTGTGYNAKIGIIVKPIDPLRLGVALHTPTFYDLHDSFYNDMYSAITLDESTGTVTNYEAFSPYGDYDYELQTPMKAIFSAAYVIGKVGLVSIDYEWVDYSKIKLSDGADGYEFNGENDEIKEALQSAGNLHIGGELRLSEYFSLRGGFEYFPSPYKETSFGVTQPNGDADTFTYSGGIGWKANGFFIDLAYKHIDSKSYLNIYNLPDITDTDTNAATYTSPTAKFKNLSDHLTFTLGFRF
ncbi:MAG: outer membrane protein transport protein [Prolixibacteraceae bacterium]